MWPGCQMMEGLNPAACFLFISPILKKCLMGPVGGMTLVVPQEMISLGTLQQTFYVGAVKHPSVMKQVKSHTLQSRSPHFGRERERERERKRETERGKEDREERER